MSLNQLDYIGHCIRSAFLNLELPQTIATANANTGKIEVGLVEEVYVDKENTDKPVKVVDDEAVVPFVVSLGLIADELAGAESALPVIVLIDSSDEELQCLD